MENLLLRHIAAGKEVQLDDLLVGPHEVADECRLVDHLPHFRRLHLPGLVNVDGSPDFVNTHVALGIVYS